MPFLLHRLYKQCQIFAIHDDDLRLCGNRLISTGGPTFAAHKDRAHRINRGLDGTVCPNDRLIVDQAGV